MWVQKLGLRAERLARLDLQVDFVWNTMARSRRGAPGVEAGANGTGSQSDAKETRPFGLSFAVSLPEGMLGVPSASGLLVRVHGGSGQDGVILTGTVRAQKARRRDVRSKDV